MKKVLKFCLFGTGLIWTMGCISGKKATETESKTLASLGPDTSFHIEPGSDRVLPKSPALSSRSKAEDTCPTSDNQWVYGKEKGFSMPPPTKQEVTNAKNKELSDVMRLIVGNKRQKFSNDTLSAQTMSTFLNITSHFGEKDSFIISGFDLTSFVHKCRQGEQISDLGIDCTVLEKALLESKAIKEIRMLRNMVEVTYQPWTGLHRQTYLINIVRKEIEEKIQKYAYISSHPKQTKKPWG
jgi:hypothetical protein